MPSDPRRRGARSCAGRRPKTPAEELSREREAWEEPKAHESENRPLLRREAWRPSE
jgi:hypothetical protein